MLWHVKLLDLPNEIILSAVEELPDDSVYALAFVCRRLHHLVLPSYLARKGFGPGPGQYLSLFNHDAWDAIRALKVALFKVKLRKLFYLVDCKKDSGWLAGEVETLKRVLDKVEVVEEVVVVFDRPGITVEGFPFILAGDEVGEGHEEDRLISVLSTHARNVLDMIVSSGRCLSLSVGGDVFPRPSDSDHQQLGSTVDNHPSRWQALRRRLVQHSTYLPRNNSQNSLTSFDLHTPVLFQPPLCLWTLDTLNYSTITKISINQQWTTDSNLGNIDQWSLILPHISMPSLTDFSLDYCAIWTHDLIAFLRRHRSLQKLYIGHHVTNPPDPLRLGLFSFQKSALRNLTHLQAPANWLTFMLSNKRSLPALSSCTILVHPFGTDKLTLSSSLDDPLEPIVHRLRSLKELNLSLSFGAPLSDWIHVDPSLEPQDKTTTTTRVHSLVTHIEACIRMYALPRLVSHKMPKWLAQFPALRRFAVYTMSGAGSFAPAQKELLLQGILESCPRVIVEFGVVDEVDLVTRTRAP
ncbi:hypothetical protein NLJ89_g487 [Agrocybe chaxingu]|uniref:F-box domain-containing protein n=1 Tax=Agrocybe chaxingu TaxID=84603 RepID=A0A9W8TGH8_9AGAR|nr:hypothetical protein NLJ89_g487 [Agrocybe chaxingu]